MSHDSSHLAVTNANYQRGESTTADRRGRRRRRQGAKGDGRHWRLRRHGSLVSVVRNGGTGAPARAAASFEGSIRAGAPAPPFRTQPKAERTGGRGDANLLL